MQRDEVAAMGIFRPVFTKPIPKNATRKTKTRPATPRELRDDPTRPTIVEEIATWGAGENKASGVIVGRGDKVRVRSKTWYARYRDHNGKVQTVSTECHDKSNAQAFFKAKQSEVERVKAGILQPDELTTAILARSAISESIAAYVSQLANKKGRGRKARVSPTHVANTRGALERIVQDCGFERLLDVRREKVSQWVTDRMQDAAANWAASTINRHVRALKAFCAWCTATVPRRLQSNPLERFAVLDETRNQKRPRRALEPNEISNLLKVARFRPVAEFGRQSVKADSSASANPRKRATWKKAPLTLATLPDAYQLGRIALENAPETLARLESLGIARELMYLVFLTTGLRKNELASVTVGQCHLDKGGAWIELEPEAEKSGAGSSIPLREDVAERLRVFVSHRRAAHELDRPDTISMESPTAKRDPMESAPLFDVPRDLVRILDRDMQTAGIPKADAQGRVVDVHSLRHTYATMLLRAGVSPTVAQRLMRHSDLSLTMRNYNHLQLSDIAGAVAMLPSFDEERETLRATGTDGEKQLALQLALGRDNSGQFVLSPDGFGETSRTADNEENPSKTRGIVIESQERVKGFEPSTFSLGS